MRIVLSIFEYVGRERCCAWFTTVRSSGSWCLICTNGVRSWAKANFRVGFWRIGSWQTGFWRTGFVILLFVWFASPNLAAQTQLQQTARGWLQLDRDQATYRERVAPLNLRQKRQLETIERSQRNQLRALQQDQQRQIQSDRRRRRRTPESDIPRRNVMQQQRRALERKRLQIRMQQDRLSFGR
jgi:hypothetical protein